MSMPAPFRFWLLAAGLLALAAPPIALPQDENLLKIECSVAPKRLSRGEEGNALIKLVVREGVLISAQPAFIIDFIPVPEISFPKNFFTASDLDIDVIETPDGTFLDLTKPVAIPFTIATDAKPGGHILEGRIKYFARSPAEGWCYKTTSKFSVAFSTRSTLIRKK
jgi:hypothetical protein